jgi:hypothetical protein
MIMSPMELKMQPTIHFRKKLDILISIANFFRKCSVGYIFNYVGLLITRELSCMYVLYSERQKYVWNKFLKN